MEKPSHQLLPPTQQNSFPPSPQRLECQCHIGTDTRLRFLWAGLASPSIRLPLFFLFHLLLSSLAKGCEGAVGWVHLQGNAGL